ncbi:MAG TPA: hypothetical protein VKB57_05840 [Acidimicrobiales bacterium]|nr:hypothetical protein [Acidimicrobiales bacterium]
MDPTLIAEPADVPVGDVSLSARVERTAGGTHWDVTVLIARRPDEPPLPAGDVTADLAAGGHRLALVRRDEGDLVEAGGGLGATANATFRFGAAPDGAIPDRLQVGYRGAAVDFALRSAP